MDGRNRGYLGSSREGWAGCEEPWVQIPALPPVVLYDLEQIAQWCCAFVSLSRNWANGNHMSYFYQSSMRQQRAEHRLMRLEDV